MLKALAEQKVCVVVVVVVVGIYCIVPIKGSVVKSTYNTLHIY
jgi:hypothetical protein